MQDNPTVTISTAHGDPITTTLDDMGDNAEVRRQVSDVVRQALPELIDVPEQQEFEDLHVEFIESAQLKAVADRLIKQHERFAHLKRFRMLYGWKKEGGKSNGRARLAQCVKPNWLAGHYAEADFVIAFSADYWETLDGNPEQIEAVMYHELCHAGFNKHLQPKLMPHEFEGFFSELEHYGDVLPQWEAAAKRFRQLDMFDAEAAD